MSEIDYALEEEEPLKIDSDVPLPMRPSRFKWGRDMEKMKVGDSVLFDNKKDGEYFAGLMNKFGYGYVTEPEDGGLRVWKVRKKPSRKQKEEPPTPPEAAKTEDREEKYQAGREDRGDK